MHIFFLSIFNICIIIDPYGGSNPLLDFYGQYAAAAAAAGFPAAAVTQAMVPSLQNTGIDTNALMQGKQELRTEDDI